MPVPAPSLRTSLAYLSAVRLVVLTVERSVYPFLPAIARGLGVPLAAAGVLLSVRAAGGFTAPLTVSLGGRRSHHRRLLLVGLALFVGGALLVAVAGAGAGFAAALVGFGLLGAARPAYDAAAQAYLADRTPYRRRARTLAVLELMYAGGLLAGAPVVGWLIARYGWQSPFVAGAVAAVMAAALLRRLVAPTPPHAAEAGRPRLDRSAVVLLAVTALFAYGAENALVVFGAWLEADFGLSLLALGGVSTVVGLAELGGEVVPLAIADRVGKRRTIAAGLAVSSVSCAVLPGLAGSLGGGVAAFALALFGFEVAVVATIPVASELWPQARARFLALAGVAMAAGRSVAALTGPALFVRGGIGVNATLSATAFGGALVLLVAGSLRPMAGSRDA